MKWRSVPSSGLPHASLSDVDAMTPSDVWAVGREKESISDEPILVEHWNGRHWDVQRLAFRASHVGAVSATSKGEVWIAANTELEKPLILHYDGETWKQMPVAGDRTSSQSPARWRSPTGKSSGG